MKSEFGEARVIPQNMENYLSITVDKLKFIDSLQFTPQSLDSLVKTLEVDEFKYEFDLIKRKGSTPMTKWIALPDTMNLDYLHKMYSSASSLTVRVRTPSMHTQLKCVPLNTSQWQTTTISTWSAMSYHLHSSMRTFVHAA